MVVAGGLPAAGVIAGAFGLELAGGTHEPPAPGARSCRATATSERCAACLGAARGSRNGGDCGAGLPIIIYLRW